MALIVGPTDTSPQLELHTVTYNSLDHPCPLVAQFVDGACDVHNFLSVHLLQDTVNGNECACTPNPSTAEEKTY